MNFKDLDLLQLLPSFMQKDEFTISLCKHLSPWIKKLYEDTKKAFIYGNVDDLPEEAIDLLSIDFHVDYYDYTLPLEKKREMFKNSLDLHRKKGTAYSVESACKTVFGKTKVKEWFEYDDDPGYFSVDIDVSETGATKENINKIEKLINIYKNERSWIRKINIFFSSSTKLYFGSALLTGEEITVYPYSNNNLEVTGKMYISSYNTSIESIEVYPSATN